MALFVSIRFSSHLFVEDLAGIFSCDSNQAIPISGDNRHKGYYGSEGRVPVPDMNFSREYAIRIQQRIPVTRYRSSHR